MLGKENSAISAPPAVKKATAHSPLFVPRRFVAILRKEYRHVFRDFRTLILVILAPPLLLLLMAYLFRLDAQRAVFAVWDLDGSTLSRRYIAALTADGDFQLLRSLTAEADMEPLLQSGQVAFVLVIPSGFGNRLAGGREAEVQALVDASDAIRAPQILGQLELRSAAFSQQVLLRGQEWRQSPLTLRSQVWYNPALSSTVSMVPGLLPIVLTMPALAFALSLARDRELGSFEGLIATPVRGAEYLLGKALAYVSLGMISVFLAWLVAVLWFAVPFRGSLALYGALALLYLAATIGIVMALARVAQTQQVALFAILIYFFVPSFFIGGLVLPLSRDPVQRLISQAIPTTHFIMITRSLFLKGLGPADYAGPVITLALMALGGLIIALLTFRKRLQ